MARKFQTTSDDKTHRFIPTKPGHGKRSNNSRLSKFLRKWGKHPATMNRKRRGHGR